MLKFSSIVVLFLYLTFPSQNNMHKYYISMCDMKYVEKEQNVQVIMNVFIDDLELSMSKEFNEKIAIDTKEENKSIEVKMKKYVLNHFKIHINNDEEQIEYLGHNFDFETVSFYLQIENISKIETMEVVNEILFKEFPSQKNIVKIDANGIQKTFYLSRKEEKCSISF